MEFDEKWRIGFQYIDFYWKIFLGVLGIMGRAPLKRERCGKMTTSSMRENNIYSPEGLENSPGVDKSKKVPLRGKSNPGPSPAQWGRVL